MRGVGKGPVLLMLLFLMVTIPPLLGAALVDGFPWEYFFELPPRTQYIQHAAVDWSAVALIAIFVFFSLCPIAAIFCWARPFMPVKTALSSALLPAAVSGTCLLLLGWLSAWSRSSFWIPVQPFSFGLLWLGYIIVAETIVRLLGGHSTYRLYGFRYFSLFLISAVFWWTFELINRFVQNWSYPALERFNAAEYIALASLAFSTVLPAVLATQRIVHLLSVPANINKEVEKLPVGLTGAFLLLICGCGFLAVVPRFPNILFPMLWIAPLVLASSLGKLLKFNGPISQGTYLPVARWSFAALVCGFFWELWNIKSSFKWLYHIPYVEVWHVFEMPLLGYAGYLPFGVLCGLVTEWTLGNSNRSARKLP